MNWRLLKCAGLVVLGTAIGASAQRTLYTIDDAAKSCESAAVKLVEAGTGGPEQVKILTEAAKALRKSVSGGERERQWAEKEKAKEKARQVRMEIKLGGLK